MQNWVQESNMLLLKERLCGPSCYCQFCTNNTKTQTIAEHTSNTDLFVDELLHENEENYVDDSEDELDQWQQEQMDDDEELHTLMEFVFGSDSSDETEQQ